MRVLFSSRRTSIGPFVNPRIFNLPALRSRTYPKGGLVKGRRTNREQYELSLDDVAKHGHTAATSTYPCIPPQRSIVVAVTIDF